MFGNFFYGILTVFIFSTAIALLLSKGSKGLFFEMVFVVPSMLQTPGCWIFPTISFLIYLFVDSATAQAYWLTINIFLSTCCLSSAMFIEINPIKYLEKETWYSYIIALIVTALFILLPYKLIRASLALIALIVLFYNLYVQNSEKFEGMFNPYNYRFLEDCIFMYFFPLPLLIFFTTTCFI